MMLPRFVAPSSFEALDPELRQACVARNDVVRAESSGALPELDDDDILADGGTERMKRLPLAEADAILAAAPPEAPVPPAPDTAPLLEDKEEDEPQRRIDRTQPFNRALLFGDNAPPRSTQPSAVWPGPPASARMSSIAPMSPRPFAVVYAPSPKPPLALLAVIGSALSLCAVAFVTIALRSVFSTSEAPPPAQALPSPTSETPTPPAADTGMPVISTDALPSAPSAPIAKKRSGR